MAIKNLSFFDQTKIIDEENVIIGSGAGGSTVAFELLKKGKKSILLEEGPDVTNYDNSNIGKSIVNLYKNNGATSLISSNGGPLFGYLSQRFNDHFKLIQLGLALSALALVMLIYGPLWHNVMLIVWMLLFGVGTGAFMLGFSLGKSMNPAYLAATIVGIINTGDALFGAITEPGIGWLLDRHTHTSSSHAYHFSVGDFHYALTILPIYLIFALVCITWLQYRLSRTVESLRSRPELIGAP